MTQCNHTWQHFQCSKEQDHQGVHCFVLDSNDSTYDTQRIRRIDWVDDIEF